MKFILNFTSARETSLRLKLGEISDLNVLQSSRRFLYPKGNCYDSREVVMLQILKTLLKTLLKYSKYEIVKKNTVNQVDQERLSLDLEILKRLGMDQSLPLIQCFQNSKSQLKQDLFVISQLKYKRGGFFVEFGATNGIDLSNTFLLEDQFGWRGILAEPSRHWHKELRTNRQCFIETDCVWSNSNSTLMFNETKQAELSTLSAFTSSDGHSQTRQDGREYEVTTISLNDLLAKFNAPHQMDYLSIDTEGSEFEILRHLDFSTYSFEIVTVEHNYTQERQNIFKLLNDNGYRRVHEELSLWDDWYVREQ